MKWMIVVLVLFIAIIQFRIWLTGGGIAHTWNLHRSIAQIQAENAQRQAKNAQLRADVDDLKHGQEAVEEQARETLGMVKPDETFVRIIHQP